MLTASVPGAAGATVLRLPLQLGAWGAMQTGLRYAHALGCERVVTLDADGQYEPRAISTVIAPLIHGAVDVLSAPALSGGARRDALPGASFAA